MVFTRPQAKEAFTHVFDNVLGKNDTSALKQSLVAEGIEDIFSLCTIDNAFIDALAYEKSPTETDVKINRGDKSLLRTFLSYIGHARTNGNPLSDRNDWGAITQEDYDGYRICHCVPRELTTLATSSIAAQPTAEIFCHGIERDSSLFSVPKEEKLNNVWHHSISNHAHAQDAVEVLANCEEVFVRVNKNSHNDQ